MGRSIRRSSASLEFFFYETSFDQWDVNRCEASEIESHCAYTSTSETAMQRASYGLGNSLQRKQRRLERKMRKEREARDIIFPYPPLPWKATHVPCGTRLSWRREEVTLKKKVYGPDISIMKIIAKGSDQY